MEKWFLPDMHYQVSVFDYGSEVEIRLYPSGIPCPGYGLPPDRESKWNDDCIMESFEKNQYGEYYYMRVHDLDEVLEREERSRSVSMARTVNKVYAIARGNAWEWFCTFTFSPEVVDRYDYAAVSGLMHRWLDSCRHQSSDMQYMVVPELHKDGAFHFHGLFSKCGGVLKLSHFRDGVYNIRSFLYGHTTALIVVNPDAASRYISKYITKDLCAVSAGKRRYWASRNVSAPVPMRCKMSPQQRDALSIQLYQAASYSSTAFSPEGEVQYYHFKKGEVPEDVMQFLKLHAVS